MATYRIVGAAPALTAAGITSVLELSPTASGERGERPSPRSPVAQVSWWSLATGAGPDDDMELATQIDRVLATLIPRRDALWQLADEGYEMDWFCYVGSYATEHAVELPRQLMQRLLAVPGDLLLDVYGRDQTTVEMPTPPATTYGHAADLSGHADVWLPAKPRSQGPTMGSPAGIAPMRLAG